MNNIGIGIMCFGDVSYFNSTKEKVTNLKDIGIDCYILTDDTEQSPHDMYVSPLRILQSGILMALEELRTWGVENCIVTKYEFPSLELPTVSFLIFNLRSIDGDPVVNLKRGDSKLDELPYGVFPHFIIDI